MVRNLRLYSPEHEYHINRLKKKRQNYFS